MILCMKCGNEVKKIDYDFTVLYFCGFCGFLREKDVKVVFGERLQD